MIRTREWRQESNNRYRRLAIVVLVLLSGPILGLFGSRQLIAVALGGIAALLLTVIVLKRPPVGLLGLMMLSFLVPITIGTGTGTEVSMSVVGLALVVGAFLLEVSTGDSQNVRLTVPSIYLPLSIFIAVTLLSFLAGQLPWYPLDPAPMTAQLGQLGVLVLLPCLVFIMDRYIVTERWLKRLVWLFLGFGSVYVLLTFFPSVQAALSFVVVQSPNGPLFWTWMTCLAFGQAFFNSQLSVLWRVVLVGITAVSLYMGLVITPQFASGWLPALVGLTALLWAARPRFAAVATVFMLILGAIFASEIVDLLLINEEYSAVTRVEAGKIVVGMVMERSPLLGFGPANYRFYTIENPILGWNVLFNSHNQYIDLLAQTGLLGAAAFLWYSVSTGALLWRLRGYQRVSGFLRALSYSLFGGLIGMVAAGMLADWLLPFVYNITLAGMRDAVPGWMFLGAALSLHRVATMHDSSRSDEQPLPRPA
ncbi:MAG: O-antigen ligase family protein [Anaerolineales bacterium]